MKPTDAAGWFGFRSTSHLERRAFAFRFAGQRAGVLYPEAGDRAVWESPGRGSLWRRSE